MGFCIRRPGELSEQAAHPVAIWNGGGHAPDVLPLLDGGELPVSPWFVSNNLELVMDSVLAGMGIALGPIFGDMQGRVVNLYERASVGWKQRSNGCTPSCPSRSSRVSRSAGNRASATVGGLRG